MIHVRFSQEPGYVAALRKSLRVANADTKKKWGIHVGGFHMDDELLVSLVSRPDLPSVDVIDHIEFGAFSRTPWSSSPALNVGMVYVADPFDVQRKPRSLGTIGERCWTWHVPDTEFGVSDDVTIEGLSWELGVDMSLKTYFYQPGTCDIFSSLLRAEKADDYVIKCGVTSTSDVDLVNHHRKSRADITWVIDKRRSEAVPTRIPVWSNGRIVVCDVRDVTSFVDPCDSVYESSDVCVMKRSFIEQVVSMGHSMNVWKKRRIIIDDEMIVRFERDLHDLTMLPNVHVNYVLNG